MLSTIPLGKVMEQLPAGINTLHLGRQSPVNHESRAHCISSSAKCSLTLWQLGQQQPMARFHSKVMHRHSQMQRLFKEWIY